MLEIGAGAAQCSRWLIGQGAAAFALDVSYAQLQHSRRLDALGAGSLAASLPVSVPVSVPVVQADACALPFASGSFDLACSAYGGVPFVADVTVLHREVARVLRPGGRWVFSVTHPFRWALPDVPGRAGLKVGHSYFDRRPYVETDEAGAVTYVEHHLDALVYGDCAGELEFNSAVCPASGCWTSWNPSGRRTTTRCGVAGPLCAVPSCRVRRSTPRCSAPDRGGRRR